MSVDFGDSSDAVRDFFGPGWSETVTEPGWAEREFFGPGWSETVTEPGWAEREFFGPGWSETVGTGTAEIGVGESDREPPGVDGRGDGSTIGWTIGCPSGYRRDLVCAAIYRIECHPSYPSCCRCAPLDQDGGGPPTPDAQCPPGYLPAGTMVCTADQRTECQGACCRCVPLGEGRPVEEQDPFKRVGDAIMQFLAGGGGGITIPQLPQPQVVAAPVTRSTLSPVAVLLIVAGLAGAGWWVYTRTRRRAA